MLKNECLGLNRYRYGLSVRHPCSIESLCHVIYHTKCAEISALYRIYLSVQLFLLGGGCGGTLVCGQQCWYSASVRNYPLALGLRCSVIPACVDLGTCRVALVWSHPVCITVSPYICVGMVIEVWLVNIGSNFCYPILSRVQASEGTQAVTPLYVTILNFSS